MSATHHYARDAEELQYGFLAARAKQAIAKSLAAEQLTENDYEILNEAASFLQEISEGAQFVDSKEQHGHRSSDSLAALTLVLSPLDKLQKLVANENQDVANFFHELSNSINSAATMQPITDDDTKRLGVSIDIFNAIYQSLRTSLSENRINHKRLGGHLYS